MSFNDAEAIFSDRRRLRFFATHAGRQRADFRALPLASGWQPAIIENAERPTFDAPISHFSIYYFFPRPPLTLPEDFSQHDSSATSFYFLGHCLMPKLPRADNSWRRWCLPGELPRAITA